MIQLAKKIPWGEQKLASICGKNVSKTRSLPWQKRWNRKKPYHGWHLVSQCVVASFCRRMACSIAGAKMLQKMWEGPYWEGVWPCLDHGTWFVCVHHPAVRMTQETWATQQAFLLPYQEGAGASHAGSAAQALRLCGNAQGVCADWFAPFGSMGCSWIKW